MRNQSLLIGGAIAVVAACLCVLAVGAAGTAIYLTSNAATEQAAAAATPAATLNPTQIADQMASIEAFVVRTRGLQPDAPVERKFLTVDEVRQRVIDDFAEDTSPEEVADDSRVLAALGLLSPRVDLYALYVRMYSEAVAGFYDPDTKELVLVSETQGFNAYERTTFAHEYNHALQDQIFGIRESGFSDEMWDTDSERAAAIQAVIEGDSSLLEEQYLDTFSRAEKREYDAVVNATDVSIYSELPDYLLLDFIFPYRQGLDFVRRYYDQDGWAGVDALWDNPPLSTEHILHPERYEAGDNPQVVNRPPLTGTLGSGWRLLDSNTLGEWYTYLMLAYGDEAQARLDSDTAQAAAAGWGGDGYQAYAGPAAGDLVLAVHWEWDSAAEAGEFAAAFRSYADERFGPATSTQAGRTCWDDNGPVCLDTAAAGTLWLMAPDEATLDRVRQEYPPFGD